MFEMKVKNSNRIDYVTMNNGVYCAWVYGRSYLISRKDYIKESMIQFKCIDGRTAAVEMLNEASLSVRLYGVTFRKLKEVLL